MEPRHPEGAEIQADGAEGAEIRPQAELRATPKGLVTLSSLLRHKGRRQLQVDDGGMGQGGRCFLAVAAVEPQSHFRHHCPASHTTSSASRGSSMKESGISELLKTTGGN